MRFACLVHAEEELGGQAAEDSGIVRFTSVRQPVLSSDGHLFPQSLSVHTADGMVSNVCFCLPLFCMSSLQLNWRLFVQYS